MAHERAADDPSAVPTTEASATLGGLLYADASRRRTPEAEWVALVRDVARGDQLALRTLYERAHRLVFTLALRLTGNRETSEELTVDVFYGLWRRAATYDPAAGTVLAWIMNHARSRAIDRLRHEHRRKRVNVNGQDLLGPDAPGDAASLAVRAEESHALRQAMTGLTTPERHAIETAFYAELSHAEVAARLHEPLGTIKTRIRSGLAKLRKALVPRGLS